MNNLSSPARQSPTASNPSNSSDLSTLAAAIAWGGRGRRVFPVWPIHPDTGFCCCPKGENCKQKHPILMGGHNTATADPQDITKLWIAARRLILKSAVKQSLPYPIPDPAIGSSSHNLIIFDLDNPGALETFMTATNGNGVGEPHVVRTGRVTDGRRVGYHYTYKEPADMAPEDRARLTVWASADGLDGRAGGKGFVVLPPSLHKSGLRYEEIDPREPGECPPELAALALERIGAGKGGPAKKTGKTVASARQRAPVKRGSRLDRMGAGEELAHKTRDSDDAALVRAALEAIDPDAFKGLTGRKSVAQDLWRDTVWSLRAWGDFWRDTYGHDLALTWSRTFASHDENAFYSNFWNYRSANVEIGRRRLLTLATKANPNWRSALNGNPARVYAEPPDSRPDAVVLAFPPAPEQSLIRALEGGPGASAEAAGPSDVIGLPKGQTLAQTRLGAFCTTNLTFRHKDNKGKTSTSDLRNVTESIFAWKIKFRFDRFTRQNWAFFQDGSRRQVDDPFIGTVHGLLVAAGLSVAKSGLINAIEGLAYQDEFDMVQDWLASIPAWDGVERAASIFTRVFGVPDTPYHRSLAMLLAAQLVRRIRQPGYKSDHMIVIKSAEGMRKSLFFSALVPSEFFCDALHFGMDDKKIIEQSGGALLCEMPELINITRKEVEHCKHFISKRSDKSRLAYGTYTGTFPRYFTLVGSTNDAKPLQSRTGNRRFLIMNVDQKGDVAWLQENFLQIWAEFKKIESEYGPILDIPDAMRAEAAQKQEESLDYSPMEDYLFDKVSEIKEGFLPNEELYAFLGYRDAKEALQHKSAFRLAKATMERAGWTSSVEEKGPDGKTKTVDRRFGKRGFFIGTGETRYKTFCVDGSRLCATIIPYNDVPTRPSPPGGGYTGGDGVARTVTLPDPGALGQMNNGGHEVQDAGAVGLDPLEPLTPVFRKPIFESGFAPLPSVGVTPVVNGAADKQFGGDGPS